MNFQKKKLLFVVLVILLGVFGFRQVAAQETLNPEPSPSTPVVPTFYCLGPCPTLEPSPTVAELLPDEPSPTIEQVTPSLVPSVTPELQPSPRPGKHRQDKDRGLIRRLLRIIERLLDNQPQPNPAEPTPTITEPITPTDVVTPTPEVSPTATPTPTAEITATPTQEPTPTPTPQPTPTNLWEQILELFRQLFEFLRQLFGFPPGNPSNPNPGQPSPSIIAPSQEPDEPDDPGQPSTAPSTTQPSTAQPSTTQPSTAQPSAAPSSATGDTQAPSTPTNLRAVSSGNTTINLTWSASTDNVRVAYYVLYRSTGDSRTGGNSGITWNSDRITGTSFSNTGLTAGTAYYYYVRAFDAAGNRSEHSNTAGVTLGGANKPNSLKVTVGLSGQTSLKDKKIPIQLDGPNGFSKTSTQGNTVNKTDSYTFTGLANGKYTLHISYGTYKSVTTTITFDNAGGGETISKSYTLAK